MRSRLRRVTLCPSRSRDFRPRRDRIVFVASIWICDGERTGEKHAEVWHFEIALRRRGRAGRLRLHAANELRGQRYAVRAQAVSETQAETETQAEAQTQG